MICFELSRNGTKICTAGVERGMLIFNLYNHTSSQLLNFDLAAVVDHQLADNHHEKWTNGPAKVGDEFAIRIVERDECDRPQPSRLEASSDADRDGDVESAKNGSEEVS